jgi:hypothetical protein
MNQTGPHPSSRQRFDHPPPVGLSGGTRGSKSDLDARNRNVCFDPSAWNFYLNFVVVETDCTGDFSWEKAIEKTILRVLGSSEFSHRLVPIPEVAPPRVAKEKAARRRLLN